MKVNSQLKKDARISVEESSKNAIILYPSLKKELLDAIYNVDKEKLMKIKIKDVLPRQISGMGHPIRNYRDVLYYHESPMIYAGMDLFDKNIITTANDTLGSYGDSKDMPSYLDLNIDYESLDEFNKLVADTLVNNGNARYQEKSFVGKGKGIVINVPCDREESIGVVNERLMNLVSKFHKQDMKYGILTEDDFYDLFCA